MKCMCNGEALGVTSRVSNGVTYYSFSFMQDGEIVTFGCTPEVAQSFKKFKPYVFTLDYSKREYQGKVFTRIEVTDLKEV